MSRGPWKNKPITIANAVKGFQRATKLGNDSVCVLVNPRDGSVSICAKAPDQVPHAQTYTEEWKLPDEPDKEIRP
jgi:hypothetical protein